MHVIQQKLLKLIEERNVAEMSLRQIASAIGESHPQKIAHHMDQLEKKGFIIVDKSEGIVKRVSPEYDKLPANFYNIPIVGAANCGPAKLLADDNITGYIKVSKSMLKPGQYYIVKADGDSMNKANIDGLNIENNDYVIVDSRARSPKHGDYVVAVVDGGATIKRFYKDDIHKRIMLIAESTKEYAPIVIDQNDYEESLINGTVKGVIKHVGF